MSPRMTPETDVTETDDPQTDVAETDDPQTDDPWTDVAETDDPQTEVPETEVPETDGEDGWRQRRWVCFVNIVYGFSGCDCPISFEWCVWTSDV